MINPYDIQNDPMFKKFFKHLLKPDVIIKSDEEGFNKYCSHVMGYNRKDEFETYDTDGKEVMYYCPYDDLNQMANVVDELSVNPKYDPNFKELVNNMVLDIPLNVKSALRDFIISTMEKCNEK